MADGASANPNNPLSLPQRSTQKKLIPDWLNSPIWSSLSKVVVCCLMKMGQRLGTVGQRGWMASKR
ncbi:hypothetical protein E2562_034039 [Oryza meyeriana var. granulata]|uniref:Uncharacterized protein n=1 Tax=Oryza meyeriana var. granulata TaxID=110450 RepID=A0A6G1E6E3_9ORYZ|nr:hypothetical protein E2562_034039 [Oryza meyeriana var. granulata]